MTSINSPLMKSIIPMREFYVIGESACGKLRRGSMGSIGRRTFIEKSSCALASLWVPGALAQRRPRPTAAQLAWQRDELAMFIHFGMNTFTNREWGDGREDPAIFNPARLDARQWARAARNAGFRAMVLTAKHHDGFCLWPTKTTTHSVARSPWRGGQGDLVREFVDACRAERLRTGLYLSPWDRNHPTYGDSPRYNDVYCAQLTELLTRYGPLAEVWFDGANGEGPNGKKQQYDWPRVWALVRRLQPNAVMFSDAGPDVRWCGNERGVAGEPNWSTVNPSAVPYPGADGETVIRALQHGDPHGTVWRPAEADTSIRPGWFYHPAEDGRVRSVEELVKLYLSSVGRNSKLLLNVPPTPEGLLHETDVNRLSEFRYRLAEIFATDIAAGRKTKWSRTGRLTAIVEIDLPRSSSVATVRLSEDISEGQMVSRYAISGFDGVAWRDLSRGSTIGYARIDRFETMRLNLERIRVVIEDAVAPPEPISVKVYAPSM
jgi:alpha-L-fucosidase